jgi:hypothetical protein
LIPVARCGRHSQRGHRGLILSASLATTAKSASPDQADQDGTAVAVEDDGLLPARPMRGNAAPPETGNAAGWHIGLQRGPGGTEPFAGGCAGEVYPPWYAYSANGTYGVGFGARQTCTGDVDTHKVCARLQQWDGASWCARSVWHCSAETVALVAYREGWYACALLKSGYYRTQGKGSVYTPDGLMQGTETAGPRRSVSSSTTLRSDSAS